MGAANKVIEGDYKGKLVSLVLGEAYIYEANNNSYLGLTKYTIDHYEIIDETSKKSAASAVGRAAVGAALLGPVGLLAGVTAKKKGTILIAITFKDGKNCLLEVDEKIKKAIITKCF